MYIKKLIYQINQYEDRYIINLTATIATNNENKKEF